MRKILASLGVALLISLVGCVTINVYFPEAAAQKAADQFIGSVIDQGTPSSTPAPHKPGTEQGSPSGTDGSMPPSASFLDLLVPAAHAGESPNLKIHTPAIDAIHARMRKRFRDALNALLDEGAVGFTQDGLVGIRDLSAAPMAQRAEVKSVVAAENDDRNQLYAQIARANGHPDWQDQIRQTFAQLWIERAHQGWYYRTSAGVWKQK